MRLIDADDLKNLPFERMIHTDFGETAIPIEEINNAPTVPLPDFKEGYKQAIIDGKTNFSRPKAQWIRSGSEKFYCSNCDNLRDVHDYYCEHCGSEMFDDDGNIIITEQYGGASNV